MLKLITVYMTVMLFNRALTQVAQYLVFFIFAEILIELIHYQEVY